MPAVLKHAQPAPTVRVVARNDAEKTGCAWCPLAPFCGDFEQAIGIQYQRDADKIRTKDKLGHAVLTRLVEQRPWDEVDILFVGEAPGADEDRQGEPFVGKSGQLLREAIDDTLKGWRIGISNVVRCRTPLNRTPNKTETAACGSRLVAEIQARKPRLIVALGNTPLEFLTGESGITAYNGRVLRSRNKGIPETDVLACFHPAYVLRFDNERTRFWETVASADDVLSGTQPQLRGLGTYETLEDVDRIREVFAGFGASRRPVAVDTETGSLHFWDTKYPGVLCLSFSNGDARGYTVPWDHKESTFRINGPKEEQREEVRQLLEWLLTDPGIFRVGQNEKFDRKAIRHHLGFEPAIFDRDTFLTHTILDERPGTHGLKVLTHKYTGAGGYEHELEDYKKEHPECDPEKGGSYANFPAALLFKYAAIDADMTWCADSCLITEKEFVENERFQAYASVFMPKLSRALASMEYTGVTVDVETVERLDRTWHAKLDASMAAVKNDPMVKQYETAERDRLVREAEEAQRAAEQRKQKKEKAPKGQKGAKALLRLATEVEFNPGSQNQLRRILFDYYKLRPLELTDSGFNVIKSRFEAAGGKRNRQNDYQTHIEAAIVAREWDLFTTDAETMQEYARADNPLASLITAYRADEKLLSGFITPLRTFLDADSRVHTNFNIGGAQTGRLSAEKPNVQQIPSSKGGGELKTPFVSGFGESGVILNIDYSQIELRVAASLYRDETMIQAYRDGQDLHTLTAIDIVAKMGLVWDELEESVQKKWRTGAKRTNFGIIYGAQAPTIQATVKKDGVFLTDAESELMVQAFLDARPGLVAGMAKAEEFLLEHGYIDSPTGRRRRIPEALSENQQLRSRAVRQGINFGVQCCAAEMTLMALCLIHDRMEKAQLRSKLVLNVHDSLVFDCHVDEFMEVAYMAKYIMEHLPEYSEEVFPGMDWTWLDVPIVADCEVGMNYGKSVGFDPDDMNGPAPDDKPLIGPNKKGKIEVLRDAKSVDEIWEVMAFKAA